MRELAPAIEHLATSVRYMGVTHTHHITVDGWPFLTIAFIAGVLTACLILRR